MEDPKKDPIVDFLKQRGMKDEDGEPEGVKQPSWLDIIAPPKVAIILGYIGKGKSALAYYLAETVIKVYDLTGVVVNLPDNRAGLLPAKNWKVKTLEDIEGCENSVIIIDEGTTKLPAGSKMEDFIKGCQSLSRQRNQVIIFIFHSSRDAGSRILRGVGPILIKEPSRRQIQFGSKDSWIKDLLETAKQKFITIKQMGSDVREFVFVDCEEPDFQGIMKNDLPSFWSDDLSKAWKSTTAAPAPEPGQPVAVQPTHQRGLLGLVATDGKTPITDEMHRRGIKLEQLDMHPPNKIFIDPFTNTKWVE
jgi:hypothetical protein